MNDLDKAIYPGEVDIDIQESKKVLSDSYTQLKKKFKKGQKQTEENDTKLFGNLKERLQIWMD